MVRDGAHDVEDLGAAEDRAVRASIGLTPREPVDTGGAGAPRAGRRRPVHCWSEYPMSPTVQALTSASATRYMPPVSGMP